MFSVSIIGVGARGGEAYGKYINECKDKYDIVALCDVNPSKLEKYSAEFNVAKENCFLSEDEFFAKKRSDVLVIATLDQDHVRVALKAIALGYAILLILGLIMLGLCLVGWLVFAVVCIVKKRRARRVTDLLEQ